MAWIDETGVETLASEIKTYADGTYATPSDLANLKAKTGSITLPASSWVAGSPTGHPYTQTITLTGVTVTANSKIDLQANAVTMTQMYDDGTVSVFVVNNNGVLTATAIGEIPTANLTFQWTLTETVSA